MPNLPFSAALKPAGILVLGLDSSKAHILLLNLTGECTLQVLVLFALTSIHENIFSKMSGDGKPVNTLTQLSRSMW